MAPDFDPYYKWLAIPPAEQPPNYYRLLGVPSFTDDPEVIENAADQRMAHLRSVQTGQHFQASQKILSEVALARECLLNPQKRAAYDALLRGSVLNSIGAVPPLIPPPIVYRNHVDDAAAAALDTTRSIASPTTSSRGVPASRNPRTSVTKELAKHVVASVVGLLLGYLILCWLSPSYDFLGLFAKGKPARQAIQRAKQPTRTEVSQELRDRHPASIPPPPRPIAVAPTSLNPISSNEDGAAAQTQAAASNPSSAADEPSVKQLGDEPPKEVQRPPDDQDRTLTAEDASKTDPISEELAKLEGSDGWEEKSRMLEELRSAVRTPEECASLSAGLIEMASQSLTDKQRELAVQQSTTALLLARKSGNPELVRKATSLVLKIQQEK